MNTRESLSLSLIPPPTFELSVDVPVPGGKTVPTIFEMKYRTSSEYDEWIKTTAGLSNQELFDSIVVGWKLPESFEPDNVKKLLEVYPLAAHAIGIAYVGEYVRVREA